VLEEVVSDLTLHCLAPQLVHTLVVGGMKDIFLVRRLDHADMAEIVHEEAIDCRSVSTTAGNGSIVPKRFEVGRKDRVGPYRVFHAAEHVDLPWWLRTVGLGIVSCRLLGRVCLLVWWVEE
jgi:hypothetical protein